MAENGGTGPRGPRCIALVGPFQSGKTTLLEGDSGAHRRDPAPGHGRGRLDRRRCLRRGAPSQDERRAFGRDHEFPRRHLHVHRLPRLGRIHPRHARGAARGRRRGRGVRGGREEDSAAAADPARARRPAKFRASCSSTRSTRPTSACARRCKLLQPASRVPLVLRQIPIWSNDIVIGFVDLALERAHIYKEHAPSEVVPLEGENADRDKEARFTMLESLADHDDELMEQLLEDIPPPRDKVFDDLAKELRDGLICPVLIGSATRTNGVLRLMKALRHEAPGIADTVKRLGVKPTRRRGRLRAQDAAHRARRQDVDRARARRAGRRRHDLHHAGDRSRPRRPACSSWSARTPRSAAPRRRAKPSRSASSIMPRPATR